MLFSTVSAPDTPPQFLHARKLSDYEVELSWQPPLEANSHILYYIVRVWNESTELLQNVTGTSVIINVDSESPYNASVSSWTRLGDGGVLIYISFTTAHTEPFDPPQNVTIANATASSITLFWHPPAEPNGIIIHYTVYYSDNNSVTGQRVPVTELANLSSPDSTYTHTVSGLIGGTNYTVWMTSSTAQGDGGVQSEPQTVFLPEYVTALAAQALKLPAALFLPYSQAQQGLAPLGSDPNTHLARCIHLFILWISRVLSCLSSSCPSSLLCVPCLIFGTG
ncbi:phosphatidylinositol phosphatase PTPRQ-like [Takifugu flavidus]|uniref:phosphatidylinositol phosphatase PTPRQ-like n=1 Tax=Takifugu flavidus TaxID=433684 RepID=UPI0025440B34|nr:phosphatidylinositol phosphatase PTPRQ-like [Takifugu flavidus]